MTLLEALDLLDRLDGQGMVITDYELLANAVEDEWPDLEWGEEESK